MSYPEQLLFVACLALLTVVVAGRGLQYGVVLAMFTGIMQFTILRGSGSWPHLTMDRVVWPIVLLFFLLERKRGKTERLPPDSVEYALLAVIAVIAASMYFFDTAHQIWGYASAGSEKLKLRPLLNGFIYPLIAYAIARRAIQAESQVQQFFVAVGLITAYFVVTGLGEVLHVHLLVFPKFILDPRQGIHFGKVRGIFLNAGFYGTALAMALPILLWLYFTDHRLRSWWWAMIAMLAAVPLVFTYQRSPWLGAAVGLSATAMAWPKRRVVLTVVLVLAASVGLLAVAGTVADEKLARRLGDEGTVEFRLKLVNKSLILIRENLVTGVGFYRFSEAARKISRGSNTSHNTFLTLFAELGLLGFIPYCSVFIFMFFKSVTLYLQKPQYRPLITLLWGITAAYMIKSVTSDVRSAAYANIFIFALWGMILGTLRTQRTFVARGVTVQPRVVSFA